MRTETGTDEPSLDLSRTIDCLVRHISGAQGREEVFNPLLTWLRLLILGRLSRMVLTTMSKVLRFQFEADHPSTFQRLLHLSFQLHS